MFVYALAVFAYDIVAEARSKIHDITYSLSLTLVIKIHHTTVQCAYCIFHGRISVIFSKNKINSITIVVLIHYKHGMQYNILRNQINIIFKNK